MKTIKIILNNIVILVLKFKHNKWQLIFVLWSLVQFIQEPWQYLAHIVVRIAKIFIFYFDSVKLDYVFQSMVGILYIVVYIV